MKVIHRNYGCTSCGHEQIISTNHTGLCYDVCRNCSWKGKGFTQKYQGGERPPRVYRDQGGGHMLRVFEYLGEIMLKDVRRLDKDYGAR